MHLDASDPIAGEPCSNGMPKLMKKGAEELQRQEQSRVPQNATGYSKTRVVND
eukprot:CAMPEP_0197666636 /NCGR_PEP_ID=MMETSP1338-20131121/63294_1 /TAXON_ID=43686 ORGANISM="Pelagodinium beii, Strain RCC1491" /NCGR_SAMPLE_ID=MMETSP1338 /ASSEMBLY_ACC=CAM_ASM_000754 /LENGTH=52 /DNA_ID=CAMNT_0043245701 /DNA_START=146 /DNA_END=301 /DNA_ORIENTATION=+